MVMVTEEYMVVIDYDASYDGGVNLLFVRIDYIDDSDGGDDSGYKDEGEDGNWYNYNDRGGKCGRSS